MGIYGCTAGIMGARIKLLEEFYVTNTIAKSSMGTYGQHWKMYQRFCEQMGYDIWMKELGLPEQEERVLEFLAHERLVRRNKIDALQGKKSAIAYQFKQRDWRDPTGSIRLKMFLKGVRRVDGGQGRNRKWPVFRRHLVKAKQLIAMKTMKGSALWFSIVLMYFFCLRSRNVVSYQGEWGYELDYILCHSDVVLLDKAGKEIKIEKILKRGGGGNEIVELELYIKKSKTDQEGKGFRRKHGRSGDKDLCVVQAYIDLCRAIRSNWAREAPLSAVFDEENENAMGGGDLDVWPCICRTEVTKILKQAVTSLGETREDYASHSLRIGGASALHAAGYSDSFIAWFGNWKTFSFRSYIAYTKEEMDSKVATLMSQVDAEVYTRR